MSKKSLLSLLLAVTMLVSAVFISSSAEMKNTDSFEASDFSFWFDYASEKKEQNDISDTGMDSFTVYMAKNEIENAQFFISSKNDMNGLSITVDTLTDTSGNTIDTEVFVEYYHDCDEYGSIPDAIPPLSAYGPVDLSAGKSQGFIIKLTTTEATVSGDYSARVTVKDASGETLSMLMYGILHFPRKPPALHPYGSAIPALKISTRPISQAISSTKYTTIIFLKTVSTRLSFLFPFHLQEAENTLTIPELQAISSAPTAE